MQQNIRGRAIARVAPAPSAVIPLLAAALVSCAIASTALADAGGRGGAATVSGVPKPVLNERQFCERKLAGALWIRTELYFGLSTPDGEVGEAEFRKFVDDKVTPRFPDGLTTLKGKGQFRGDDDRVIREGARVLILFYPYSDRPVLRVDEFMCVGF